MSAGEQDAKQSAEALARIVRAGIILPEIGELALNVLVERAAQPNVTELAALKAKIGELITRADIESNDDARERLLILEDLIRDLWELTQ